MSATAFAGLVVLEQHVPFASRTVISIGAFSSAWEEVLRSAHDHRRRFARMHHRALQTLTLGFSAVTDTPCSASVSCLACFSIAALFSCVVWQPQHTTASEIIASALGAIQNDPPFPIPNLDRPDGAARVPRPRAPRITNGGVLRSPERPAHVLACARSRGLSKTCPLGPYSTSSPRCMKAT